MVKVIKGVYTEIVKVEHKGHNPLYDAWVVKNGRVVAHNDFSKKADAVKFATYFGRRARK